MQTKLYRIQFSHHPMTNLQSDPEQQLQNLELTDFANLSKLPELPDKFELPDERGFKLTEVREKDSFPLANPRS